MFALLPWLNAQLAWHRHGAPETIRTSDLPLRRRLLYPAELPGLIHNTVKAVALLTLAADSQTACAGGIVSGFGGRVIGLSVYVQGKPETRTGNVAFKVSE